MEVSNDGVSVFHRFQASFVHDGQGSLLFCNGPREQMLRDNWDLIKPHLSVTQDTERTSSVDINEPVQGLRLYQQHRLQDGGTKGILLSAENDDNGVGAQFERFFVQLVLDQIDFALYSPTAAATPSPLLDATDKIVSLFDTYLRYQGAEDKWEACGRAVFEERVRHFTSQGAQIQLCLPAFPCKSTNTNKVTGKRPDRGEELALGRLHSFVEAVEEIYEPGAKLWVISDGHVFSDCIGVDDADVDSYGEQLKEMNHSIGIRRGRLDRVDFRSLVDLFELADTKSQTELAAHLSIPGINHHVETQVTHEAEMCRQILMAGCQPRESTARERIKSQDESLLALYRGFSRFMLEDLEMHPFTQEMSKSQRKKLSTKVAFEMIMRNQAYSNLVEILFPNYVRLSIHAHNNAGPKFGIQLFDPSVVRAVESLSPEGIPMTSRDLLHIPTPWHNCVVEMEGSEFLLVTKAKIPQQAIASGVMGGGMVSQGGAHFVLKSNRVIETTESKDSPFDKPMLQRVMSHAVGAESSLLKFLRYLTHTLASIPVLMSLGLLYLFRFKI